MTMPPDDVLAEIVKAAQDYDTVRRAEERPWQRATDRQVARLITGAWPAIERKVREQVAEEQRRKERFTELVVYPAVPKLYGTCEACGQARHVTEFVPNSGFGPTTRSEHCGCCTHPHDLTNGCHRTPEGEKHDPAACGLCLAFGPARNTTKESR